MRWQLSLTSFTLKTGKTLCFAHLDIHNTSINKQSIMGYPYMGNPYSGNNLELRCELITLEPYLMGLKRIWQHCLTHKDKRHNTWAEMMPLVQTQHIAPTPAPVMSDSLVGLLTTGSAFHLLTWSETGSGTSHWNTDMIWDRYRYITLKYWHDLRQVPAHHTEIQTWSETGSSTSHCNTDMIWDR